MTGIAGAGLDGSVAAVHPPGMTIRDRESLIRAVESGLRPKWLFFWGHRGPPDQAGCLSQWYPSPFEVEGDRYPTAEHWMMAGKARLFGDAEMLEQILTADSPAAAKAFGRKVRGFDPETWDAHKWDLVVEGNVHKFGQNEVMGGFLRGTGNRVLVEASPPDRIWGIGLGAKDEKARNPRLWNGQNLLGFALMEARERLFRG